MTALERKEAERGLADLRRKHSKELALNFDEDDLVQRAMRSARIAGLETEISELAFLLGHAKPPERSTTDPLEVAIGSTVTVDLEGRDPMRLEIRGQNGSLIPIQGAVSLETPLAKAVLGRHQGGSFEFAGGEGVLRRGLIIKVE